ncbi:XRE family transcriptional regulator [Thauera propionica]|uniref:XRE family transcriptional regulator n=1 Tax=Thauera propionica TaxID=2019431 RepID=UPI0023F4972B|nr:XRE family transcriptional regulator [Thauera propionica]MDD3675985.1 XRE family transcriptional regulator [Thauera propionica]
MTGDKAISRTYEDAFAALYSPDVAQLKRTRAYALRAVRKQLEALPGTQHEIATQLGIKQPRLNKILRGEVDAISLDNLVLLAARAGLQAEVIFKGTGRRRRAP